MNELNSNSDKIDALEKENQKIDSGCRVDFSSERKNIEGWKA